MAAGALGLAAARGRRRVARRAVAAEPWPRTSAAIPARRFATVRHLAGLFDRYALHRPEMVRAWAAGDDAGIPADAAWQAELYRRLRARIGEPDPAERLARACARLREEPELADLPPRLSAVRADPPARAATSTSSQRSPPAATSTSSLLHPSPALWEKVARRPRRSAAARTRRRRSRRTGCSPRGATTAASSSSCSTTTPTTTTPVATAGDSLLHRLQAGVRDRRGAATTTPIDRQRPDPLLPRPRPPGRGPAGRDPARARRGPDARAARRDRHVPRHRDLRAAHPGHVRDRRRVATCASASPTARCARPTPCSASSPACSSSPASASPPRRCSTSPAASPSAAASASTTTGSARSRSGSAPAASAGGSTPPTGRRSSSTSCRAARGGPGSTGCCSAWR